MSEVLDEELDQPLNACHALGMAIAFGREAELPPRARKGATANDIADAAYAMADMRQGGWDVRKGSSGEAKGNRPEILATLLAEGGQKQRMSARELSKGAKPIKPTVRQLSEADLAVDALRAMGYDLFRVERPHA